MDNIKWEDIEHLFWGALNEPEKEREAWLKANCTEGSDVYNEVAAMLKSHTTKDNFLKDTVTEFAPELLGSMKKEGSKPFQNIKNLGPYKIFKKLGHGGMGAVFLAEHTGHQIERQVALKVLRPGFDEQSIHRRFIQEERVLSSLEHPGIARLYDAGVTNDGRPYFSMEYVEGISIDRYCQENNLSLKQRLQLFKKVSEAVQYAHRKLVVHRDLKPSNILVKKNGVPILLDFGIAKLLTDEKGITSTITSAGHRWMTPEYASPEQIKEEPVSISTDVYALGALLYKLLTGTPPFRFGDITTREMEQIICDEMPQLPSEVVANLNKEDELVKKLKGDLDIIILKALRKEPERRYRSVDAFIDDIERHINHLPVLARPDTLKYRTKKFFERNRIAIVSTAAAFLLVAAFVVFYTVQITRERNHAQAAAKRAEAITAFTTGIFKQVDPYNPGNENQVAAALTLLKPASRRVFTTLKNQPEIQADLLFKFGELYQDLGRYDLAKPLLLQTLSIREAYFGYVNENVAATLHAYGEFVAKVEPDSAATYFKQAVQIRRKLYKGDNPKVAESLLQWARYLPYNHPKKQKLYKQAIAMYRRIYGRRSLEVANAIYEYYIMGYGSEDQKEIIEAFRKVIAIHREHHKEVDLGTAIAMHNLGLAINDLKKGLALLKQSYEAGLNTAGLENKAVRQMGMNVAATFYENGKYKAADSLLQILMAVSYKMLPDSSNRIAYTLYWYGRNIMAMGQLKKAEKILRKALNIYAGLPLNNNKVWRVQRELGACLTKQGRYREAEQALLESYPLFKEAYGNKNPLTQIAIRHLVHLYEAWDKPKKATRYRKLLTQGN